MAYHLGNTLLLSMTSTCIIATIYLKYCLPYPDGWLGCMVGGLFRKAYLSQAASYLRESPDTPQCRDISKSPDTYKPPDIPPTVVLDMLGIGLAGELA